MTRRWALVALLAAALWAAWGVAWWAAPAVRACEGKPGNGPFTVVGWVTDEAGRPVPDLTVALIPLTPGNGEPDYENGVYQVEERDDHQTRTNGEGLFVMPGVYDYPAVTTQRYQVVHLDPLRYPDRNPFVWLEGGVVDLADREPDMVKVRLTAHPAGGLDLTLVDATGRPSEGTWPLLVEVAGRTLIYTARFTDGRHRLPGLPPGPVHAGLFEGELGYFVQAQAQREGKPIREYLLRRDGQTSEAQVTVTAGAYTAVRLVLP